MTAPVQLHASALNRVVNCNGSVEMVRAAEMPDDKEQTDDQREGDAAHHISMQVLSGGTGYSNPSQFINKQAPNGVFITAEMADAAAMFTDDVMGRGQHIDRYIEVNCDFDLSPQTRILARPDVVTWDSATRTLCVDDFKHGWRIVEPFENWTLIAYVMSAINMIEGEIPERIRLTIHQPRPHHESGRTRTWELSYNEWYGWFTRLIEAIGTLSDILHTGPHCYKCPALASCRAARDAGYNSIDASHKVFNDKLSDIEIEIERIEIMRAIERLEQRGNAISELMMHRIEKGAVYQNHYIERGEGHAKFNAGITPQLIKTIAGIDVRKDGMLTPAQAIKAGVPESVIKAFSTRPKLAAKLVNKSATKRAEKLFGSTPKG